MIIKSTTILFIMKYAKKVKKDPSISLVYHDDTEKRHMYKDITNQESLVATKRQKIGIGVMLLFFIILVYRVITQGWFMVEMSGLFIVMGIVVGLARSIAVVLEDGKIMDSIVRGLGSVIDGATPTVVGMYIVQVLINFIISSGSGQALVTMPIMAPLADMLGITRQTPVLAFQLGDGFTHVFYPTSGYFMAALAIGGVSYTKWIRFFFPLFIVWGVISIISLIFAQLIGWS
ncbi:TIGR00366 family protein [Mammaliicoccus sciuri]|uniref:TIGR00366 family protein n=1 Tax=Mammaliicoccus sciuri TaxID=1296 RepID=UPI0021D0213F|nr:TIGR00366 family protein [Mammaliicoccus sciuri]UXV32332.1 TIGR00366 family protein [Mammaliicoccus sciuri]